MIIAGITHATVAEEVGALLQRNSKYRLNGSKYIHSIGIWDKLISRLKNDRKFGRHLKKRNMFSNMLDNGQGIYCSPTIQANNTLKPQIDDDTQGWKVERRVMNDSFVIRDGTIIQVADIWEFFWRG